MTSKHAKKIKRFLRISLARRMAQRVIEFFFLFECAVLVYLNAASEQIEKAIVPLIGLEFSAPALAKGGPCSRT